MAKQQEIDNPDWGKRVDRLLSTSVTHQVGSALEALHAEISAIAEAVASVAGQAAETPRAAEALTRIEALERSLASLDAVVRETAGRVAAVDEAVHGSAERLGAVDEIVRGTVDRLAFLGERIEDVATRPDPPVAAAAVDPGPLIGEARESLEAKLELLSRQIGAPLGRVRVQLEELAGRVAAGPDESLPARLADLSERLDAGLERLTAAIEQRAQDIDARTIAFSRELADAVGALAREVDARLPAADQADRLAGAVDGVAQSIEALRDDVTTRIAAIQEQVSGALDASREGTSAALAQQRDISDRRFEAAEQQWASLQARVRAALETIGTQVAIVGQRIEGIAALREELAATRAEATERAEAAGAALSATTRGIAEDLATARDWIQESVDARLASAEEAMRASVEQTMQGKTVALEAAVRTAIEEAVRARISEMETGIGGVVADRVERARGRTEDAISAALDRVTAALEPAIARRIEAAREAIEGAVDAKVSAVAGEIAQTAREATERSADAMSRLEAAVSARADEAERMAGQLAARLEEMRDPFAAASEGVTTALGSIEALSARMSDLGDTVRAVAERPSDAATIRDELASAIAAAAEPVAAMRDGMKSMVDLFAAMGERLAALEKESTQASRAVKGQTETVASAVADTVRSQVAEMMEHVGALDRRLLGIASAEQVADAMQRDRDVMEKSFGEHGEQLQTLSGSAGAIYVRVRALEHAFDEMRKESEGDRTRFTELLNTLKEVMALEQRLSVRFASMENRIGETDVLRDREFAALLAELAEMVSKGDRARFAEKLRVFERRAVGSESPQ